MDDILKYWQVIVGVIGVVYFLIRHIYTLQRKLDAAVTEERAQEIVNAAIGELRSDISSLTSTIHSAVREFDQKAFQLAMHLSQDKRGNE